MSASAQLDAAESLARAQLARLEAGDFDGYAAAEAEHAADCEELLGRADLQPGALTTLIGLQSAIATRIQAMADDVRLALAGLQRSRSAAAAYLQPPAGPGADRLRG